MASCQICQYDPPQPPPSAPEHILNSNAPIQTAEVDTTRGRIAVSKKARDILDAKIEQLRNTITSYEATRQEHDSYVTRHESLLAPYRSVPPEIWGEIFQTAQRDFDSDPFIRQTLTPKSPSFLLSHVCRSWRAISMHCPTLWCVIKDVNSGVLSKTNGLLILDVWLTRSSGTPLNITVSINGPTGRRTLNLLLAHSYHWRKADITVSRELLQSTPFTIKTAPILETLMLTSNVLFGYKPQDPELVAAGSVPSLKTVSLYNIHPTGHVLHHLPWYTVECVHIRGSGSRDWTLDIKGLLSRCTSLSHLGLGRIIDQSAEIRHDRLESLKLSNETSILRSLKTPTLKQLELQWTPYEQASIVENFIGGCHGLQEIILDCGYSGHSNISTLGDIESMTDWTVERIKVQHNVISESLATFLAKLASGKGKYLPRLVSLELHFEIDAYEFNVDIEAEVLRLRDAILDLCRQMKTTRGSRNETPSMRLSTFFIEVTLDDDQMEETALVRQAYLMLPDMDLEGLAIKFIGRGWEAN